MGIQLRTSDALDLAPLDQQDEWTILKLPYLDPEVLEAATLNWEPYRLVTFPQALAARFHAYHDKHRLLGAGTRDHGFSIPFHCRCG